MITICNAIIQVGPGTCFSEKPILEHCTILLTMGETREGFRKKVDSYYSCLTIKTDRPLTFWGWVKERLTIFFAKKETWPDESGMILDPNGKDNFYVENR